MNKLADQLREVNGLHKDLEQRLTGVALAWEKVEEGEKVDKSIPADITVRIERLLEAIRAVDKQLNISVLTGKKFDRLDVQTEILERVRVALDTLKSKVKKMEKEVEMVSG